MTQTADIAGHPQPRGFVLLSQIPTQPVLFVFTLLALAITLGFALSRYAQLGSVGDIEPVLWFLAALVLGERGAFIGKRATSWKPEQVARAQVIAAGAPPAMVTTGPPTAAVVPLEPGAASEANGSSELVRGDAG